MKRKLQKKKSKRLSQKIIQRTIRVQKKFKKAFIKISSEIFKDIRREILKEAILIFKSKNLNNIEFLDIDFTELAKLIYVYSVESRKLGRLIGMTESLELKQYWQKRQEKVKLSSGFQETVENLSNTIMTQIITSLSPQNIQLATSFSVVPQKALDWYSNYSLYLTGVIEKDILTAVKSEIYIGIEDGLSIQNTKENLIKVFEKKGIAEHLTWRAENIARTEMAKAFQAGKVEAYTSEEMDGFIVALQFSAILDSRITNICEELQNMNGGEGLILKIGSPLIAKYTPPLHFQCRSSWIPLDKYSAVMEGLDQYIEMSPDIKEEPLKGFGGTQADISSVSKYKTRPKVEVEEVVEVSDTSEMIEDFSFI